MIGAIKPIRKPSLYWSLSPALAFTCDARCPYPCRICKDPHGSHGNTVTSRDHCGGPADTALARHRASLHPATRNATACPFACADAIKPANFPRILTQYSGLAVDRFDNNECHMQRTTVLVASLFVSIATAAFAVDTPTEKTPPDLTGVRAKIKAKDFASARDDLFKLVDTHQHADVFNLLGFSLRKTGDYQRALTYYKKALDFDPQHLGALEYLGELYVETKQIDKAKEQLAKLVALCPKGCEEREDLEKAIAEGDTAK